MVRVIVAAVILTLLGTIVLAAPVIKDEYTQLKVVSESNNYKIDDFNWSYVLSDGREVKQNAYTKQLDDETIILVVNGFYSYVAPDGVKYTIRYYADENGYHPTVIVGDQPFVPPTTKTVTPSPAAPPPLPTPRPKPIYRPTYTPPAAEPPTQAIDPNVLKSLVWG